MFFLKKAGTCPMSTITCASLRQPYLQQKASPRESIESRQDAWQPAAKQQTTTDHEAAVVYGDLWQDPVIWYVFKRYVWKTGPDPAGFEVLQGVCGRNKW